MRILASFLAGLLVFAFVSLIGRGEAQATFKILGSGEGCVGPSEKLQYPKGDYLCTAYMADCLINGEKCTRVDSASCTNASGDSYNPMPDFPAGGTVCGSVTGTRSEASEFLTNKESIMIDDGDGSQVQGTVPLRPLPDIQDIQDLQSADSIMTPQEPAKEPPPTFRPRNRYRLLW